MYIRFAASIIYRLDHNPMLIPSKTQTKPFGGAGSLAARPLLLSTTKAGKPQKLVNLMLFPACVQGFHLHAVHRERCPVMRVCKGTQGWILLCQILIMTRVSEQLFFLFLFLSRLPITLRSIRCYFPDT